METSVPLKMDSAPSFLVFAHPQQAGWEPCSETNSQDLPAELKRFGRYRVSFAGLLDHSSEERKSKCIYEHVSQQLPFLVHFLSLRKSFRVSFYRTNL